MESTDLDTNVDCVEEVVEHEVSEGLKLVIFKICNFILKTFFFYGKKTSVSNSTPCNDKRFLGKSECVTSYVILPFKFEYFAE